ncbi:hypothetical protein OsI_15297 [Oryza sativa Indica Group]|uniref:Pentatricopeptide repeat-containing protein n=1 Tax=Oryza sativa subsp. indica TaxID=39946 RepID=B8AS69_ORYSI|nr:hypothetical protein OsI_15297 [Oryza sativa Indica Group]
MPRKTTATYNCLLTVYSRAPGRLADARHLFNRIPTLDAVSYNLLLSCHFTSGDADGARRLFASMRVMDVMSWNTMVSGLSKSGAVEEAKAVFLAMPVRNSVSWNAMVSRFACSGDMSTAEEWFRNALEKGDTVLWTAMVSGYMDIDNAVKGIEYFEAMPVRNLVSWNGVVAGYLGRGGNLWTRYYVGCSLVGFYSVETSNLSGLIRLLSFFFADSKTSAVISEKTMAELSEEADEV